MALVDWIIVVVLVVAVLGGLSQGFFRSVCALGGLLLGLSIAAWNYGHLGSVLMHLVRIRPVADAIAFLLIALLVMAIVGMIGSLLARAFSLLGLGWLDGLAGAAFGFLQGLLLVTVGILVIVAFFPQAHWLAEAKLPRMFFGVCHLSTHMSPAELAARIRHGLTAMEEESPYWMHPGHG